MPTDFTPVCPFPIQNYPQVLLAHGGGGKLMHQLIGSMFVPAFKNPLLEAQHDSSVFPIGGQRLAMTTDSYVVRPLFFPGGDIGSLAVHGTVNDLAMSGARPLYLSAGFIIEEGLPMDTLWQVVSSMQRRPQKPACKSSPAIPRSWIRAKATGCSSILPGLASSSMLAKSRPPSVRPGDAILVNGDLGRHGMAIMAVREGLEFESAIESDSAPLAEMVLQAP